MLNGLSCFQQEIHEKLELKKKGLCPDCGEQKTLMFEMNGFFIIDVEDSYRDNIIEQFYPELVSPNQCRKTALEEIPTTLESCGKHFFLSGIVAFNPGSPPHYFSVFNLSNGYWMVRDNKRKYNVKETSKFKIAFVLYCEK